ALTGHTGRVVAVATAVLPEGRVVAVTGSYDVTVRVWDLSSMELVGVAVSGHRRPVGAVATAGLPDGRVVAVTGSHDATVRVWDLATMEPVGAAQPMPYPVRALAVTQSLSLSVICATGSLLLLLTQAPAGIDEFQG